MSDNSKSGSSSQWTTTQAYTLSVICLVVGIAGGWLMRGSQPVATTATNSVSASVPGTDMSSAMGAQMPTPDRMKKMADTQAAPLLEKLKTSPNDAELLAQIGNVYYDTHQFPTAVEYYQRALKVEPKNASVRTDMGTAIWYEGNADAAISEFTQALKDEPNKASTLLNLGIVRWQGKMDVPGAVQAWETLLKNYPNYEDKEKVQQLIAQAQKHANVKPGTQARPLPQ